LAKKLGILREDLSTELLWSLQLTMDHGSGLHQGKPTILCMSPVTVVFQAKIHWAEVQSCFVPMRWYIFSVVSCVIRDVHKFDFRLVINEALNKWRPVERRAPSDRN